MAGFYCKQTGHCGKGMTFSINPTAAKTQTMFQSMAIAQNGTGAGTAITGGAAAPAAPAAAAPAAPAAAASNSTAAAGSAAGSAGQAAGAATGVGGATTGVGTLANGQCQCAVQCTAGSLPAAQAQAVGNFGGITGEFAFSLSAVV